MTTFQRQYDVFRVTRGGVTRTAINVNHDEAMLNMAMVLAAYDAKTWQLQPENPRGLVRILNLNTNDYHMVIILETEASERRAIQEREAFNHAWLARTVMVNGSEHPRDYTVDPDVTPTDGLIYDLRDGDDEYAESAGV